MSIEPGEPDSLRDLSLPRSLVLGAGFLGLLLFAMVALLTLTLVQLHDSGGHIESQDKKISALFELGRPLAARADDLGGDVGPALDDARTLIERFPALSGSVQQLTATAVPLLDQVDPALIGGSLSTLTALAAPLAQDDRLVRLVDGLSAALADVSNNDLVARAAHSAVRIRKLLAVQRRTRALQAQALRVQKHSLAVQKRSLRHVRSIDEKTGGQLPQAPVP
jgi:hypothetical protein